MVMRREGSGILEGIGRKLAGDAPVPEHHDALGVPGRGGFVRHHHDRHMRFPRGFIEQRPELLGGMRIEVAGRLIGEKHRGFHDQRPGDRDALLLPAGERIGAVVGAVFHFEQAEEIANPRAWAIASRPSSCSGSAIFSKAESVGMRLNC